MVDTTTSSIVFTDLVGSTQLRAEMGEEAADRLRRRHDESLGKVVTDHGGNVVKGGGDGLLCTFDAASDALAAAIGMQQAIAELAREIDRPLSIRVGVSVGDVTWEDGDCFGMPVVEAARLEAAAESGEILASEFVRVMARGRGSAEFAERGALDLKGVPDPVVAYSVAWEPRRRVRSRREATPYVGRGRERDFLRDAWLTAGEGAGSTVFVAADAGMGKTRLIDEFVNELDGATVLYGTCHSGEVAPYAPLADAITSWARAEPSAPEILGDQASIIANMVPALHTVLGAIPPAPAVEPDVERRRLHDALDQLIDHLCQRSPVLVVIDDLHWIDLGSLAALRVVTRAATSRPMLVICLFRDVDLAESADRTTVVAEIEREATPRRIDLHGLDTADVAALLRRLGDVDEVPADFVARLQAQSSGNPLFIRETLLNLVEEGKISRDEAGEWRATEGDIDVPSVLRQVIDRRLQRLDERTVSLLGLGALFETAFPLDATAEVAELAEEDALDAVDEALDAQVVEPTEVFDEYRFTHAMFRHVLADRHNPSRRPRLHRRLAEALEKRLPATPSASEIAVITHQYLASAALPGAERGVPYALDQARALERSASFEEALSAYESARSLLPDGDDRLAATLLDIARATALAGRGRAATLAAATAARDALETTSGPGAAVEAVVAIARIVGVGDVETAWRLADLVRPMHDGSIDESWVRLRGWELASDDWEDESFLGIPRDTPARRELHDAAVACGIVLPVESGFLAPDVETARAMASTAEPLEKALILGFFCGDFARAAGAAADAQDRAERAGDVGSALLGAAIRARLLLALGRLEEVGPCLERGATYTDKLGDLSNPVLQYFGAAAMLDHETNPTVVDAGEGAMGDLMELVNPDNHWLSASFRLGAIVRAGAESDPTWPSLVWEALDLIESTHGGAVNYTMFACWVVDSMSWANRGLAVEDFEQALQERIIDRGFRYPEVCPLAAVGVLASLRGDPETARHWFERSRAETEAEGRIVTNTRTMVRAIEAELRLGADRDHDHVEEMLEELEERCTQLGLDPGWHPFLTKARSQNAAGGMPFNPPIDRPG